MYKQREREREGKERGREHLPSCELLGFLAPVSLSSPSEFPPLSPPLYVWPQTGDIQCAASL